MRVEICCSGARSAAEPTIVTASAQAAEQAGFSSRTSADDLKCCHDAGITEFNLITPSELPLTMKLCGMDKRRSASG